MTETVVPCVAQNENTKVIDSLGFLFPNIQMKVVDPDTKKTVGPNMPGELCFKMSAMMLGYYKNSEETNKIIDSEGIGVRKFY